MLCCDGSCYRVNICAVMAAVVVWTSKVLWWQLLSYGHLQCCDGSCCSVNISSAVMSAVIVWTSLLLWWQLLSCGHLLCCDGCCVNISCSCQLLCKDLMCCDGSCYCVNISCAVKAAVVVWTSPVLWWQLLCEHLLRCNFICRVHPNIIGCN